MSDCSKRWWPAVVLLVLIPVSCSPYGKDVREALRYAGDNREELEHVIRHYSQDKASPSQKIHAPREHILYPHIAGRRVPLSHRRYRNRGIYHIQHLL